MKIRHRLGLALLLGLATACSFAEPPPGRPGPSPKGKKMDAQEIVTLVEKNELSELSWPTGRAHQALAAIPEAKARLRTLAVDPARGWEVRFKALEAFFALGGKLTTDEERQQAARTYAEAIEKAREHNPFELPGAIRSGLASKNLLGLGADAALPALRPLFKSQRLLVYEGSEEPTLARLRKYRVADLAGALAAALLGRPFPAEAVTPRERDEALQRLE